ncbi:MAG: T9SS type A sorting domain-containing protein [Bacteroidota bacterium]
MKRTITTFVWMLLLTGYAGAQQQITNAGFESWDTIGGYSQPSSWFTLNALTQFGYDPTTTLTTDAHSGSYAVKLESLAGPSSDLSGVLCTGPILNAGLQPDFSKMKVPFSSKPQSLEVYFKSFPQPGDICVVAMFLTRWNVALQKTDTVAEAGFEFDDSVGVYTLATCPFVYSSPLQPDSMFIIASSSKDGFNPTVESMLILDDLRLTYSTGLNDITISSLQVYPNPANTEFAIHSDEMISGTIKIYSVTGTISHEQDINAKQASINVSALADGIYMMVLQSDEGMIVTRKIKVQH